MADFLLRKKGVIVFTNNFRVHKVTAILGVILALGYVAPVSAATVFPNTWSFGQPLNSASPNPYANIADLTVNATGTTTINSSTWYTYNFDLLAYDLSGIFGGDPAIAKLLINSVVDPISAKMQSGFSSGTYDVNTNTRTTAAGTVGGMSLVSGNGGETSVDWEFKLGYPIGIPSYQYSSRFQTYEWANWSVAFDKQLDLDVPEFGLYVDNKSGKHGWYKPGSPDNPPPAVPLPAAAWLFGSALLGFITLSKRRRV